MDKDEALVFFVSNFLQAVIRPYTPVNNHNDKQVIDLVVKMYADGKMSQVLDLNQIKKVPSFY